MSLVFLQLRLELFKARSHVLHNLRGNGARRGCISAATLIGRRPRWNDELLARRVLSFLSFSLLFRSPVLRRFRATQALGFLSRGSAGPISLRLRRSSHSVQPPLASLHLFHKFASLGEPLSLLRKLLLVGLHASLQPIDITVSWNFL